MFFNIFHNQYRQGAIYENECYSLKLIASLLTILFTKSSEQKCIFLIISIAFLHNGLIFREGIFGLKHL